MSSLKEVLISDSDAINILHFCFKFFRELFIIKESIANTIQKLQKKRSCRTTIEGFCEKKTKICRE